MTKKKYRSSSEAVKRYQKKTYTRVAFVLSNKNPEDCLIAQWLSMQGYKSEAIRTAILCFIREHEKGKLRNIAGHRRDEQNWKRGKT